MAGSVLTGVRRSEGRRALPLSGLPILRHGAGTVVGARGSAAGSGAYRSPSVPWRRSAFNTEETENARSSTEVPRGGNPRAPLAPSGDFRRFARSAILPSSVELRAFSVSSVLKMRRQIRPVPIRVRAGPSTGSLQQSMTPNPFIRSACRTLSDLPAMSPVNGASAPLRPDARKSLPSRNHRRTRWQPDRPPGSCHARTHHDERQRPCDRW
jgi:hypothetical protein